MEVQPHVFLASALDVVELFALRSGDFTPADTAPDIHCIGGWVCSRMGLDYMDKR
jgi:hypothetical protein